MAERDATRRAALPQWAIRTVRATIVEGANAGTIATGAEDRLTVGSADSNDLVLGDPLVSRYHAEIFATQNGLHVHDVGSTNGTIASGLRIESAIVPPGTKLVLGSTTVQVDDGSKAIVALHEHEELGGLIGQSLPMRRAMAQLANATDVCVRSSRRRIGDRKEVAARPLHEASTRADGPFVVVDCASLVPSLVSSELFGHERGAFTGADRTHVGAFERANGGTLFLDEIGELPPEVQPNLLGALERRRIRRVGGKEDIAIDVRVVSATHRDVRADVNAARFRLDLYYRLAVVTIELPPLRARRGDIRLLASHFVREAGHTIEQALPPDFFTALETHAFPGKCPREQYV